MEISLPAEDALREHQRIIDVLRYPDHRKVPAQVVLSDLNHFGGAPAKGGIQAGEPSRLVVIRLLAGDSRAELRETGSLSHQTMVEWIIGVLERVVVERHHAIDRISEDRQVG